MRPPGGTQCSPHLLPQACIATAAVCALPAETGDVCVWELPELLFLCRWFQSSRCCASLRADRGSPGWTEHTVKSRPCGKLKMTSTDCHITSFFPHGWATTVGTLPAWLSTAQWFKRAGGNQVPLPRAKSKEDTAPGCSGPRSWPGPSGSQSGGKCAVLKRAGESHGAKGARHWKFTSRASSSHRPNKTVKPRIHLSVDWLTHTSSLEQEP